MDVNGIVAMILPHGSGLSTVDDYELGDAVEMKKKLFKTIKSSRCHKVPTAISERRWPADWNFY